jgi:hypothetical protein
VVYRATDGPITCWKVTGRGTRERKPADRGETQSDVCMRSEAIQGIHRHMLRRETVKRVPLLGRALLASQCSRVRRTSVRSVMTGKVKRGDEIEKAGQSQSLSQRLVQATSRQTHTLQHSPSDVMA